MANISRKEYEQIKEWQRRTGGGCIDSPPQTQEELIRRSDAEVKANMAKLRRFQDEQKKGAK